MDGSFYFLSYKKMENELRELWLNLVSCVNSHLKGTCTVNTNLVQPHCCLGFVIGCGHTITCDAEAIQPWIALESLLP